MKKIVIPVILFLLLIPIAGAWYFSSQIIDPKKKPCPQDHFKYCGDPSELGLDFENVSFKSADGLTLKGWYIPAKASNKAVLLVHGHGATRHEGLRWIKSLNKKGFNTMVFDLRHSGESDTAPISMGYHEKNDVISAIDYLDKIKGIHKIGLFGVSMGSASGIMAMSKDLRIMAGVFEAGYADFEDLIVQMAKRDYGLPRFPIVDLMFKFFEVRSDSRVEDISPEKVIGKISPRPIFIMHCKTDPYIPYSHATRLMKNAGEPKQLWTHNCTSHAEAWQADPAYIETRVADFFVKNVR